MGSLLVVLIYWLLFSKNRDKILRFYSKLELHQLTLVSSSVCSCGWSQKRVLFVAVLCVS